MKMFQKLLKACFDLLPAGVRFNSIVMCLRFLFHDMFEPFEVKVFKENIKEGDVILDLGANYGYYTLLASRLAGEKGKVYAFEPAPDNFEVLKNGVKGKHNITTINKAVSDKKSKSNLYLSEKNPAEHSLFAAEKAKSITVDAVALDDFFSGKENIDFIKMDIEGSEIKALKGMRKLLKANKDAKMLVEFNPHALSLSGSNPAELLAILEKSGYEFYHFDNEVKKTTMVTKKYLLENYTTEKGNIDNIFCIRKRRTKGG